MRTALKVPFEEKERFKEICREKNLRVLLGRRRKKLGNRMGWKKPAKGTGKVPSRGGREKKNPCNRLRLHLHAVRQKSRSEMGPKTQGDRVSRRKIADRTDRIQTEKIFPPGKNGEGTQRGRGENNTPDKGNQTPHAPSRRNQNNQNGLEKANAGVFGGGRNRIGKDNPNMAGGPGNRTGRRKGTENTNRRPAQRTGNMEGNNLVDRKRRTPEKANEIRQINYERLRNLFDEEGKKAKTRKGVAKFGEADEHDIVIFDESHYLKSPVAARTKLARKLERAAKFTLWVSATAGQNPLELSYLSRLLGHLTGSKPQEIKKSTNWCREQGINVKRGKFGKWLWEKGGKDNEILHDILFKNNKGAIGKMQRHCRMAGTAADPKTARIFGAGAGFTQTEWEEFIKAVDENRGG